jgi:hypothetical protein
VHLDASILITCLPCDSLQDGRVLQALVDSMEKGLIDFTLTDPLARVTQAMDIAEQRHSIPRLLDPTDIVTFLLIPIYAVPTTLTI